MKAATGSLSSIKIKPRIVIVGGGPAGAATAKFLADMRCFDVHVFEAYPFPTMERQEKTAPIAYVIGLNRRGQNSLCRLLNLYPTLADAAADDQSSTTQRLRECIWQQRETVSGFMMTQALAIHPTTKAIPRPVLSVVVARQALAAFMLRQAEDAGAHIHVQHALQDLDLERRVATFAVMRTKDRSPSKSIASPNNNNREVVREMSYDLLVAADGSKSRVRSILAEQIQDFQVRLEQDDVDYQIATIPNPYYEPVSSNTASKSNATTTVPFPPETMHIWNDRPARASCFAFPLSDGKELLLAIIYPNNKFDAMRTACERGDWTVYQLALDGLFPDLAVEVKQEIAEQLFHGRTGPRGLCVWTSRLGSPKHGIALVGDSGHGMWATLGQGANCALESAAVFGEIVQDSIAMDSSDGTHLLDDPSRWRSWSEQVVQSYHTIRSADATAAVDLTFAGIGHRRSRWTQNAPLYFRFRLIWMAALNRMTNGLIPATSYQQLTSPRVIPYSEIHRFGRLDEHFIALGTLLLVLMIPLFLIRKVVASI